MKSVLRDPVPLALIAFLAFLFYDMGKNVSANIDARRVQYEQCIAADKQWINGNCLK